MWPTYYIPRRVRPRVVPRFFLTTQPYPIFTSDSVTSLGIMIGGYRSTYATDSFDSDSAFLGGELVVRLKTHVQPEEAYQSATEFLGGVLITRLLSYTAPPEDFESDGVFVGGTLQRILITYSNWPQRAGVEESLASDTAFLGGTLQP